MKLNKHQLGISMVEVLVALVISLFLLGGIVQVYVGSKGTYGFTDAISRIQENGRFAMDIMAQDLRMAGFWGCTTYDPTDTENIVNNLDVTSPGYDPVVHDFVVRDAIEGTENDGLNGSDSITVRGSKPNQTSIRLPYNSPNSNPVHVSISDNVEADDIVMVSNCRGADIFQVTSLAASINPLQAAMVHVTGSGSPGNYNPDTCAGVGNSHCLSQTYGSDSSMFELQAVVYTIAVGASGEPALWRSENGTNVELIDGIEELQVLYGVDTDNDNFANQYVVSTAVVEMDDVIAIRIMLLVRSEDAFVVEDNQRYVFNGNNITAGDLRVRQVFTTTIGLRNRIGS